MLLFSRNRTDCICVLFIISFTLPTHLIFNYIDRTSCALQINVHFNLAIKLAGTRFLNNCMIIYQEISCYALSYRFSTWLCGQGVNDILVRNSPG